MTSNADEQSLLGSDHVSAGHSDAGPSRRQVLAGAGGVGLLAAAPVIHDRPKKASAS